MKKYNYKNCQSLFGYSANVHIRCKAQCQLCGCGGSVDGSPIDFDLWRQMTVEHLIGKSQGGYLKQIRELVETNFYAYSATEKECLAEEIDAINTVTACQFCNSTTSRDISGTSMYDLFQRFGANREPLIEAIKVMCNEILFQKQKSVKWKLDSIKDAFKEHVVLKIERS